MPAPQKLTWKYPQEAPEQHLIVALAGYPTPQHRQRLSKQLELNKVEYSQLQI